jgi:serine/threonine protein kinase
VALQPGTRLGPYDVLEKLGEGGMGQVFKARDTRLGRLVAIKQSATQFGDRFEREARAVAARNHPNICHVYDVGPDYFVMEFLEGRPLVRVMTTVDFPRTADNVSGLSLSRDGKRLYTSYADAPLDIWMLEGFR